MFDLPASCMKVHWRIVDKGHSTQPVAVAAQGVAPGAEQCLTPFLLLVHQRWGVPGLSHSLLGFQVKNLSFVVLQEGWHTWQGGTASGVGRVAGWMPHSHFHPTAIVRVSGGRWAGNPFTSTAGGQRRTKNKTALKTRGKSERGGLKP